MTKNADDKKDEIELSDEQYEKDINMMRKLESTKDLIEQYRKEAYDDINRIKREIETTVDDKTRFRLVRRGISNQTRLLAGLLALNSLRPRRSRLASFALTTAVGIAAIGDMLSFDTVEEHYKEITRTETLLGVDNVDTEKARSLITESKGQIERILEDCEKKYKDYPQFDELKQELLSIQEEIDKEDKLLLETEKELENYRKEERVKILKKIE